MSEAAFKAWGEQATVDRDAALSASIVQQLKGALNRL